MQKILIQWQKATSLLVCLIVLTLCVSSLPAQEAGSGTIKGTIVDPRGQAVQGAAVAVASPTAVVGTAVSGADGKFTVTGLPAGAYTVETSSTGFGTDVRHNVVVTAGQM